MVDFSWTNGGDHYSFGIASQRIFQEPCEDWITIRNKRLQTKTRKKIVEWKSSFLTWKKYAVPLHSVEITKLYSDTIFGKNSVKWTFTCKSYHESFSRKNFIWREIFTFSTPYCGGSHDMVHSFWTGWSSGKCAYTVGCGLFYKFWGSKYHNYPQLYFDKIGPKT